MKKVIMIAASVLTVCTGLLVFATRSNAGPIVNKDQIWFDRNGGTHCDCKTWPYNANCC